MDRWPNQGGEVVESCCARSIVECKTCQVGMTGRRQETEDIEHSDAAIEMAIACSTV